jgi:large subunit ribosomal protein L32
MPGLGIGHREISLPQALSTPIGTSDIVKMASAHITTRSILSSFLPRFSQPAVSKASRFTTLYSRQLSTPLLPSLNLAIPSAISLNIPGLIEGLWESILRAVPKKKTSHSKGRSRRLAGKALKDVTNLVKCPGCGSVKRAHVLCPFCVAGKLVSAQLRWMMLILVKKFRIISKERVTHQ